MANKPPKSEKKAKNDTIKRAKSSTQSTNPINLQIKATIKGIAPKDYLKLKNI